MRIKPIRTESDYAAALAEIDRLWGASFGSPAGDKLDVLVTLVEAYKEQHDPILPPDPIAAIRHYMESQGLKRKDLEPYIGTRERRLSMRMIRNLQAGLGIPADILIQPYHTA